MYENARIEVFKNRVEIEHGALLSPFDEDGEPNHPYFSIWYFKDENISGATIANMAETIKEEIIRRYDEVLKGSVQSTKPGVI